jgi:hypothetical protein
MRARFGFCWYDLWVGVYWSRRTGTAYICLLPCLVLTIETRPPRKGLIELGWFEDLP